MKTYTTYIFDLDGTITDTTGVWIQIFRDCLQKVEVDQAALADDEIAKHTHDWSATIELGVKPDDIPAFAAHAKELAHERLPDAELFPGALGALQALKANDKNIAIFSTMDRDVFEPAMQHHKLYDITPVAIAGTDVLNRKPAPDGILKALEVLGVAEKDFASVMYMGDKDTDIQAAHNAGVHAVLFFPPMHQAIYDKDAVMKHDPEVVITSWQELLESL